MERDFFCKRSGRRSGLNGLRWWTMITSVLPVSAQCRLLKVARSSLYYPAGPGGRSYELAVMLSGSTNSILITRSTAHAGCRWFCGMTAG